jgi:hypothetical protein
MVDLTDELSQQLRALGISAAKRAQLLQTIRAEVASEILEAGPPTPNERSKYLAINACRRLGVLVDGSGITLSDFDQAVSKDASSSARMDAKAMLHYSGLLHD